jgi:transcriptional regulator with XRE-family HTH domain
MAADERRHESGVPAPGPGVKKRATRRRSQVKVTQAQIAAIVGTTQANVSQTLRAEPSPKDSLQRREIRLVAAELGYGEPAAAPSNPGAVSVSPNALKAFVRQLNLRGFDAA